MWIEFNCPSRGGRRYFINFKGMDALYAVEFTTKRENECNYTIIAEKRRDGDGITCQMGMYESELNALDACRRIMSKMKRGEKWLILDDDYDNYINFKSEG